MFDLVTVTAASWLIGKVMKGAVNAHFEHKTQVLELECLYEQLYLQVEKENELLSQFLMVMHFLGEYHALIKFRMAFLDKVYERMTDTEGRSFIDKHSRFYEHLELVSRLGSFIHDNPKHELILRLFYCLIPDDGTKFRSIRLDEIRSLFYLESYWSEVQDFIFQYDVEGKDLECMYLQALQRLTYNSSLSQITSVLS